jgi:hypothetical protein
MRILTSLSISDKAIYIFTSPSGIQLIISASPNVEITSPGRRARGFVNPWSVDQHGYLQTVVSLKNYNLFTYVLLLEIQFSRGLFFVFSELTWEVIVCFGWYWRNCWPSLIKLSVGERWLFVLVDIGRIVDHHCLNFL